MYQLGMDPDGVVRGELPDGHAGTARTLELMRGVAAQGGKDPVVRTRALQVIADARIAGHDFDGELIALHNYVANRIRYVRDPLGVETLQYPRKTLELGQGDCDDKAMLLVAMLRATSNPADLGFRVIGTDPRTSRFSHVYVTAYLRGRRIALDPTRAGTPAGWEFPRPTLAGEVRA